MRQRAPTAADRLQRIRDELRGNVAYRPIGAYRLIGPRCGERHRRAAQIAIRSTHGGTVNKTAIAGVILGAVALAMSGCSSSSDESMPTSTGPAKVAPPAILQAGALHNLPPHA